MVLVPQLDEETEQVRLQEEEKKNEWEEAEVPSHVSLTQEQEELIKEHALDLQTEVSVSCKPHRSQAVDTVV